MRRLFALLSLMLAFAATPLLAQDQSVDDKTFLEGWLEDNLSAAGRDVTVSGFAGALSSQATMDELTIADDEGVWFILRDATLDWTRSALLTGRLEIDALSAREMEVIRRPVAISDGPQAEASDFALPELPVSIDIGQISADRVILGAGVLGTPAELRLSGEARLEGGAGEARLSLERIDGQEGQLRLAGSYANTSRQLSLDLALHEGPDGIAAKMINLPGSGPIDLAIAGEGPLDSFDATISLATDGSDRIGGKVTLRSIAGADATETGGLGFHAELAGDPTALLSPDTRAFFGDSSRLVIDGSLQGGQTEISAFSVKTDAMTLDGSALLQAGGWPSRLRLQGRIASDSGEPVRLPVATPTFVDAVDLDVAFDAATGDRWTGAFSIEGLSRDDLSVASAEVTGSGQIFAGDDGGAPRILGRLDLAATGLAPSDPAMASALGDRIGGSLSFARAAGEPLALTDIALEGAGLVVTGDVSLDTDFARLDVIADGNLNVEVADLARFAEVTGQPLTGGARLGVSGNLALPGGPFDIAVRGTAQDLGIGQTRVDPLFAGASTLAIDAVRDAAGTRIDRFDITSGQASARGSATLKTGATTAEAQITINSGTSLAPGFDGPVRLTANGTQVGPIWRVELDGTAPGDTTLSATVDVPTTRTGLGPISASVSASIANLAPYSGLTGQSLGGGVTFNGTARYVPDTDDFRIDGKAQGSNLALGMTQLDQLIGGESRLTVALRREAGVAVLERLDLETAEITAEATGTAEGDSPQISLTARLRDLGRIVPGLPGPATAEATANLADGRWRVSGTGNGPGGTRLAVSGSVGADGADPDLSLQGRAPLAIANAAIAPRQMSGMADYDLTLRGGFGLPNVSGVLSTSNARLSLPSLRMALEPISGAVRLSGGQATLDLNAAASSGGRLAVQGTTGLAAPYGANLTVQLMQTGLTDPTLYDTAVNGTLTLTGPLTGGAQITGRLGFTSVELRIPETGFGASGALPELKHVGEPAAVRETRRRAGLLASSGGGGGTPFGLDITVDAPSQIFLRGRGLDAEFGGSVRILGTTQNVIPQGGFSLIRGRLDLLGKRLVINQGTITLQGSLDPYIRVVAETQADDTQVRIIIEGLTSEPTVTFASSPDLPEDEILARLIFGRGLDKISPFQALKLASAVATLAGQGGAGTVDKLRQGFGLDDLDVTTNAEGELAVRAGTYITDNIYTDVTVSQSGNTEINLNLNITPNLTARGSVTGDGETGLGIFYEKDY